jgi:hypothetical protein
LKNLAEDKTIVISKADKGNAVVIQDIEVKFSNSSMQMVNS